MPVGATGQNLPLKPFLYFLDNVLNAAVVLRLLKNQVFVFEKKSFSNADKYFQII